MPELPEVETIVRALNKGGRGANSILEKKIISSKVFWKRSIEKPGPRIFTKKISGQKIFKITRRGKYIHFHLSKGNLFFHLRMSGDIVIEDEEVPVHKHVRVNLSLDDSRKISFYNPRKFGRVWLVEDPDHVTGKLGIEPFDDTLNADLFFQMLNSRKRQLKPLLMDQSFIAGLGNIYTDEALHLAGLHPLTPSNLVGKEKSAKLLKSIRSVLSTGIRNNGASFDWVYKGGEFQNEFRVYKRKDENCPECGAQIKKMVVGQRGTHFCPSCQSLPQFQE